MAEGSKSANTPQRRDIAISIIDKLLDESKGYKDQTLRVRIQARAADALWDADDNRAKALFMQAWEIAERVDKDGERNAEDARQRFMSSGSGEVIVIPPVPNLRGEVLRLAAQRDSGLGEMLLAMLEDARGHEAASSDSKITEESVFDPTQPKPAVAKRLELAVQLLEAGRVDLAKLYAEPALSQVTSPGMVFLYALRQGEAADADKRYARLLAFAADDPTADATTVSLLSSYALTPNFLVTATRSGRTSRQLSYDAAQTYELSPELRAGFFSVASKILLRPIRPPEQDHTSAGRAGTYFTIARLLPLFEQHAPKHVPALNAQLAMLAPDAPETFRSGEETMLRVGIVTDKFNGNGLPDVLNQLAAAANSGSRDAIYVKAIQVATTRRDAGALELAERIEDAKLREQARAFTALATVRGAISKKDVDGTLRLIREGNLLPLNQVWAGVQLASLVKKTDPALSLQLLNEATTVASRISLGVPERAYALVCVARALFETDRQRSWELAGDAVKAANAVPDFSGEDGKLYARLRAKSVIAVIDSAEPSFNMPSLFALLAKDDLYGANSVADRLAHETSRASASFAIARYVLNKPAASANSPQR